MQNPLFRTALITLGSFLLVIGVVTAWTGPTANPPGNNTPEPVTVSNVDQIKAGGLELGSLVVRGSGIVRGNLAVQQNLTVTGSGTSRPTVDADADTTLVTKGYLLSKVGGGGGDNLGNHIATQNINMNNTAITNMINPTQPQDGATKKYVDDQINTRALTTNLTGTIKGCTRVSVNAGGGGNGCSRSATASCASGEVVVGGGGIVSNPILFLTKSEPNLALTSWSITATNENTGPACNPGTVTAYAICCKISP